MRKGFIWQQSDKADAWQTMDEDSSGPHCSCGTGMDDSRLCFCLAGSFCRQTLAPSSAFTSYGLVVLGSAHTSPSLGGSADPGFQQTTWATRPSAYPSEPGGRVLLRLSPGHASGRVWDR